MRDLIKISSVQICKPWNRDRRKSAGFSLLEILIAIGLVAIISVVAIPSMMSAFRTTNEAFASKTTYLLKEARDRALLRKKIIRFSVDFSEQNYWLDEASASLMLPPQSNERDKSREDREREKKEDPFKLLKELTKSKVKFPFGVKITAVRKSTLTPALSEGVAEVFFYPDGTCDSARIFLEDDQGIKMTIVLHPITGQGKLQAGAEGLE